MRLHRELVGSERAPMLILAGSLGTTLRMWDGQLPLSADLRLLLIDHRGHGASGTPAPPYEIGDLGRDVLDLMDEMGIDRASFAGLSIGGMVGMWLAANAPERIERLVVICTSAYMPPASAWQERAAEVLEAGTVASIAGSVVERWLTSSYAADHPATRDGLSEMVASSDPIGYIGCCGAIERMDLRDDLSRIVAPTLVISGSDDPATPEEHQVAICEAIRGARHEIVGPAAHLAPVEQPDAVNRLILGHLT